jgi:membrane fusion protein, multidrug efflux system
VIALRITFAAAVVLAAASAVFAQPAAGTVGVVRAHDQAIMQSESAGIVDRILVKEGDVVTEGQTIVELRRQRQEIALEAARAGLLRAEAQGAETSALLDAARKELERSKIAADVLAKKDLDDARDAVERLEASLRVQMADVSRAQQEVKLREHELKQTRLVAPFAGTVTRILVHRGDALNPVETQVAELVDMTRLFVEVLLPRQEALRLNVGTAMAVRVESEWLGRAGSVTGHVSYVNPTVDAASRMVTVKIDVPNPTGAIRPGMVANVRR